MKIQFKTRNFYPDELRLLKKLKSQKEKAIPSKMRYYHFIIAGILGVGFTYITTIIPDSFWTFLLGTIAVLSFSFIVFMPYELYKMKRKHGMFLQQLNSLIDKGMVDTCQIKAKRIAFAPEYEDENDLYIIELDTDEILYLWDTEYNLNKKFPCLEFEIYDGRFYEIIGKQIYILSEKIKPINIDKKAKWNYLKQYGIPEHLEIEKINFDDLLHKYNSFLTLNN